MDINEITGIVVDSAMKVHSQLGAGLLEHVYEVGITRLATEMNTGSKLSSVSSVSSVVGNPQ